MPRIVKPEWIPKAYRENVEKTGQDKKAKPPAVKVPADGYDKKIRKNN